MSAILSADDLNDFISPGVACIKPIETLLRAPAAPPRRLPRTRTSNAPPAEISLTDCLACSGCVTSAEAVLVACSGCVTSAEAVLVSMQSHTEVLNTLDFGPSLRIVGPDPTTGEFRVQGLEDESRMLFVASVSPQTRASLAAAAGDGTTERQAGYMLDALFSGEQGLASGGKHGNGFTWVLDTNVAREACLVLGADEVLGGGSAATAAAGASPSPSPSTPATKPILTSSCPGWVCYAEKTHPYVLPHLSRVKSPQALMGTLLKTTLSKKLRIPPSRIWHLAVMPCFDKKLEASREELTDSVWGPDGDGKPGRGVRDVDCVITSKEVLMLAESRGFNFFNLPRGKPSAAAVQHTPFPDTRLEKFLFPARGAHRSSVAAGSSGGNLYFTLQTVASKHPNSQIQVIRGRNADVVEFVVASATGDPIFKAARYYGFRNIQNLVRKLKPARPSRMPGGKAFGAARRPTESHGGLPGGCTNGGGQIKVDDPIVVERKGYESKPGPLEQKDFLAEVDEAYFSAEDSDGEESNGITQNGDGLQVADDVVDGISPSYIRDTLAHWADCTGIDLGRLALTTYREVVSDVGKDKASDTERVVQLAGKIGGGW
ncbi:iron only hydrogenase large subunit domain-containing protein [Colletotrichum scovillei]|uniref:iron only hydrogenase large subunit domain-containing protein n=1 Tax=Colletotrichum scovillei TaxID=1209932 RepID=UPI0015C3D153|nr:iron only hydrogenase large subunit domain-containing protein [Colletotrichum scovillei]KAF4782020.1 iron only hydrogenase large subunit domain-containing protein [Colletotrichum scovillei]